MRIVQLILVNVENSNFTPYSNISNSKYVANIEPMTSNICEDNDLEILNKI